MDQVLRDHLMEDLRTTLAGSDLTTASFLDLFFAYRLLLQRYPEFDRTDPYLIAVSASTDLRGLVGSFVNSPEFQRLWFPDAPGQPDCVVMTEHAGLRFFFHFRDRAKGLAIAAGQFETGLESVLRSLIQPGMCCVDVGASFGFFSILMGSLTGPSGRVYSLEPYSDAFHLLGRNIRENQMEKTVRAYNLAAHERNGKATLGFRADAGNGNTGPLFLIHEESRFSSSHGAFEISCRRLDDLISPQTHVDLVKIAVQGSEPHVIRGMQRILRKEKPILLIELNEFWLEHSAGAGAESLLALLDDSGYIPYELNAFLSAARAPYRFEKRTDRYEFCHLVCAPGARTGRLRLNDCGSKANSNGSLFYVYRGSA